MHSVIRFQHPGAPTPGQFLTTYSDHFGRPYMQFAVPTVSINEPASVLHREFLTSNSDQPRPAEPDDSDLPFVQQRTTMPTGQFQTTYRDHFGPQNVHPSMHRTSIARPRNEFLSSAQLWLNPRTLPNLPSFPGGKLKQRQRSMITLVTEKDKTNIHHQHSLRQQTSPRSAKLRQIKSLSLPRTRQQSSKGSRRIPSTSRTQQPESGVAGQEPEQDYSLPALNQAEEQEVKATQEEEKQDNCQRVLEGTSAQVDSPMLSLTINNKAMKLQYGLVKKSWSEIQLSSVKMPLCLPNTSMDVSQVPALTVPLPLLSNLVPAPLPLPPSFPFASSDTLSTTDSKLPEKRSPTLDDDQDMSPKPGFLAGFYLLLSFFFRSFRFFPVFLPSSYRRLPA